MTPPTVPALIEHAAAYPFLREHLVLDAGTPSGFAYAQLRDMRIESGYQPIFDVSMNGMQTLWSAPESADRFGDEAAWSAVMEQYVALLKEASSDSSSMRVFSDYRVIEIDPTLALDDI